MKLSSIFKPYKWAYFLICRGIGKQWPDDRYLKLLYFAKTNRTLNLEAPVTFNEKLQWLKLYNRRPEYIQMADKVRVREYVAEIIGPEYLIPLLGTWENPEDIDFNALPERFVLKCNHNSGRGMYICRNKSEMDISEVRDGLAKGLEQDYYLTGRKWPYKDIPRRILAEQYMEDSATDDLRDYKFFCFDGVCHCFKVDFDRFTQHRANYYDPQGNFISLGEADYPPDPERKLELPDRLEEMVGLAQRLSQGIPFVRVDLYYVDGRIYFGEMTFFPAAGTGLFTMEKWDRWLGEKITLPPKDAGQKP